MPLFQNSVVSQHLKNLDFKVLDEAWEKYKNTFLSKVENIKTAKEEQYQSEFLNDIFVKVLGYILYPNEKFDLVTEFKNKTDSKKADGAILRDEKVLAVIELKSIKTKSMDSIVDQAFNYKNNHPSCRYIITSNFAKLRFYIDYSDAYEEFDLFAMKKDRFKLFYYLLNRDNLFADLSLKLKEQSKLKEQEISNELYKKYAGLRRNLFNNLVKNNPHIDKLTLLTKTQTLLDRMVFIFFAEDRGILPPNTIAAIIEHYKKDIEDRSLYHFYKIYFKAISEGNPKIKIPAYNGGLFAEDALLDSLVIDDDVLDSCPLALSAYDFNTDIDVNILGHIFENSLSDIEEMRAEIEGKGFDKSKTKRKKDGVFYTPEYITKYIVDNTLGTLCHEKKEALGLANIEINIPKTKSLNKTEKKILNALEAYREYLLGLKILDPACGSGAFLNQALNFLLHEHAFIDEGIKTLMGGHVLGLFDVKKGILENNLYGVDINAEAVEIAKLSLWLRTVEHGRKLNILSGKIKVGNSLIDDKTVTEDAFVWEEEFPEVFEQGGFDCVIGNPPYVRQELLAAKDKAFFKAHYRTYHGTADLYIFFVEKGYSLLKQDGMFGYIFPNKWMRANYGKAFREWLQDKRIKEIIDFGDLPVFEDATTYPIIMRMRKRGDVGTFRSIEMDTLAFTDLKTYVDQHHSLTDQRRLDPSGWTLSDIRVQALLEKIENAGIPLGEYVNGEIYRGVLTGLNEAFVIDEETKKRLITEDPKSAEIIKPFLAGRDIKRYETPMVENYLIFTRRGIDINAYPAIKAHLELYKERLMPKPANFKGTWQGRKAGKYAWYEIQDTVAYWENFEKPKIIIPAIANRASYCFDPYGNYSNDKTSIIATDDLHLLGLLNSSLLDYYLKQIASTKQNGYFEYKPMYVSQLPICKNRNADIEKNVTAIITYTQTFQNKKQKFLKRLQSNFEIEKLSKKLENFYELDFKTFLKELKKKKVTLDLKEQDEWEEYFESYQKELLDLKAQIAKTDGEIDKMVYALYGLSEEEIKIIEVTVT